MNILKDSWSVLKRLMVWTTGQAVRALFVSMYFTIILPVALIIRLTRDVLDLKSLPGGDEKM